MKREVLIQVGNEYVEGLGTIEKTVPFKEATKEQLKLNPRIIIKNGEIVKKISTETLIKLDEELKSFPKLEV